MVPMCTNDVEDTSWIEAKPADAEFIVRAVNHHDDLVAALGRLVEGDDEDAFNAARELLAKVKR